MTDTDKTEQELVEWAASFGPLLAEHAQRHDREGSFVVESHNALREAGLLAIAVPEALGGRGATIRQVAMVQRELAKHCAATALSSSMHQHIAVFLAWRYRRDMPGADVPLKRILEEKIVLVSTGGADFTSPRGSTEKVDGGYRVSGTKIFASQSPVGTAMSTMMPYDDPDQGKRVLNMTVPLSAEGVTVLDNWDSLGMRGTGSNDITLDNVFVPDAAISANREWGVMDGPLQVIAQHAIPIIIATYLGVAESAYAEALRVASSKATEQTVQRQVGLMSARLQVASWALDGALATVGDDPTPSMEGVAAVMAAKRLISEVGLKVCDLAMEVAGGQAYFKGSPIERAYRDFRGIKYHPLQPELALLHAGRVALGQPAEVL